MARSAFNLGVLGMLAQSDKMVVIGDNIANVRTTAYKANRANFAELFVTNAGQLVNGVQNQFGNGVQIAGVTSDWSPGALEDTAADANVALEGDGFFATSYPSMSETLYTRAGDFALVEAPNAINNAEGGFVLMRPNGVTLCMNSSGDINTNNTMTAIPKPLVFVAQKYAAVGGVNTWREWAVATDGPIPAPTSFSISTEGLVTAVPKTPDTPAIGDTRVTMKKGNAAAGSTTNTQCYIPIQRFNNPDSLEHLQSGMYRTTDKTSSLNTRADGLPQPSLPNTNGCGRTRQGMLEASNVDLVTAFTDMIITQRSFQANSKTITTSDEMLQTVMQLKN